MLHFFFGLFFLLLTLLLTGLYLCTGVLVVLLVKGVYHVYRQWREVPLYGAWRDAAGESLKQDLLAILRQVSVAGKSNAIAAALGVFL